VIAGAWLVRHEIESDRNDGNVPDRVSIRNTAVFMRAGNGGLHRLALILLVATVGDRT
jgi:hypothetical protein